PAHEHSHGLDIALKIRRIPSLGRTRDAKVLKVASDPHLLDTNSLNLSNRKFGTNHQIMLPYEYSTAGVQRSCQSLPRNCAELGYAMCPGYTPGANPVDYSARRPVPKSSPGAPIASRARFEFSYRSFLRLGSFRKPARSYRWVRFATTSP